MLWGKILGLQHKEYWFIVSKKTERTISEVLYQTLKTGKSHCYVDITQKNLICIWYGKVYYTEIDIGRISFA